MIRRVMLAVLVAIAGLAIAIGGPSKPSAMPSINDPFESVNFSDLPKAELMRSIQLFGEKVIPALRSYEPF